MKSMIDGPSLSASGCEEEGWDCDEATTGNSRRDWTRLTSDCDDDGMDGVGEGDDLDLDFEGVGVDDIDLVFDLLAFLPFFADEGVDAVRRGSNGTEEGPEDPEGPAMGFRACSPECLSLSASIISSKKAVSRVDVEETTDDWR